MPDTLSTAIADSANRVTASSVNGSPPSWQQAMREAVRTAAELCRRLELPASYADRAAAADFPVFAPLGFIDRMRRGDPADPLLRQILPLAEENLDRPGFVRDPLAEQTAQWRPGLLQKYRGRALMVTTGTCAVHCRYCFRRHFPYGEVPKSPVTWQASIDAVAADPTINEVILSGGDPLTVRDEPLAQLAQQLGRTSHVRRLRIHSRLPIVIPERITDGLLSWLTDCGATPIMVVHANHAQEIDAEVARALSQLVDAGVVVLNQAVLLRGVNDSRAALVDLCHRLVNLRVMPYYLHQLDRVTGAAHFEVPVAEGKRLIDTIRAELPGYAVPRYVQEIPGQPNKVVLR